MTAGFDTNRGVTTISTREAGEHPQVMTLKQAAAYLRISKAHLSNVINRKVSGVPPMRYAAVGRRILIKRVWADQWLEEVGERSLR
jgi:excisionase family DNA binding protein